MPKPGIFAAMAPEDIAGIIAVVDEAFRKTTKRSSARAHRKAIAIADQRMEDRKPPAPDYYADSLVRPADAETIGPHDG